MKIAVKIDPKKIKRLKEKIKSEKYINNALDKLAVELTRMFVD